MYVYQRVTGFHMLPLLDHELDYPPGQFPRHPYLGGFGLPLDNLRLGFQQEQSNQGQNNDNDNQSNEANDQTAFFLFS